MFPVCICLLAVGACQQGERQPRRSANFKPYRYQYSIEELKKDFSERQMARAKNEMAAMQRVIEAGPYKADLELLKQHPLPEWFRDAKFGLFYDFGLYSVAGYGEKRFARANYPDCYLDFMYGDLRDYHIKTWGADFERDDFIGLFTAKNYDAEAIAGLAVEAGAKYFVQFDKHGDGYCLWDSGYTFRDSVDMPPGRNLAREMVDACRKNGLKYGFYFSVEEWEYPLISRADGRIIMRKWAMQSNHPNPETGDNTVTRPFDSPKDNRLACGKVPVYSFIDEYLVPQAKEFIDKYDPDILWFDAEWDNPASLYKTPDLAAYFCNKAQGRKEVAVGDRYGRDTRGKYGDFFTSETDDIGQNLEHYWEENRPFGESYGYYWKDNDQTVNSATELVKMLVRIVAKGGNLILIVTPDGTGRIPDYQVSRLKEIGEWLKVNGEAIYATRPARVLFEDTQLGRNVWYTRSKDGKYNYAILMDWPKSDTIIMRNANPKWDKKVYMLGYDKPLEWIDSPSYGMAVKLPQQMKDPANRPCRHAWVIKYEYDSKDEYPPPKPAKQ